MVLITVKSIAGRTITTTTATSTEITTFKTALQTDHIMVSGETLLLIRSITPKKQVYENLNTVARQIV